MRRALLAGLVALVLAAPGPVARAEGGDTGDGFFLQDDGHGFESDADADRYTGPAPLIVRFAATTIHGSGGSTYRWSFDDGRTSGEQGPRHTFDRPGWYAVTLDARDGAGHTYRNNLLLHVWRPRDWAILQQRQDLRIVRRAVRELERKNARRAANASGDAREARLQDTGAP
jgi:hypothetical protein